ncbi:MAG TPA: TdeIII family type II restriction endonuclease, partial [Firmicutes bacterium]|nr:TdeIII family type II restriction endonuclease [Bacillota bacterium]
IKEFVALKLKLMRWTGLRLSQNKNAKVFTRIAIPYNPYHPEPYERWTLKGLFDLSEGEILVGEEFWNFVASDDIYDELLDVFQSAGEELRDDIDRRFKDFTSVD